jgi:Omp85 superfamily domain/Surface antigen variable number repeat
LAPKNTTDITGLATENTEDTKGAKSSVFLVFLVALLAVPSVAIAQETIAEIRVHGNHTTPDSDVISLSGLSTGAAASEAALRDAETRLRSSDRFDSVEVRRRFRSIDNASEILVVILVDERAAVSADDPMPGPLKRLGAASQWLPVLDYADGYGFTYGIRVAFADAIGARSRVAVPLTWGGERRAGVDVERAFDRGPISFVRVRSSINRRENLFYDVTDLRRDVRVDVDRALLPWLRVGADGRIAHVEFGDDYAARHSAAGVHVAFDTRIDPSFPRNAIDARIGWERLAFADGAGGRPSTRPEPSPGSRSGQGRWLVDARGYVGIGGPAVFALRGQLARADGPLPAAEQPLLGGSDSLRGYRAGHRAGDSLAAVTAEVRYPLTSPIRVGRLGVKGFIDAGTTWASGERLADQRFERGIGGGVFFGASVFMLNFDLGWPEDGKPRGHLGIGISF